MLKNQHSISRHENSGGFFAFESHANNLTRIPSNFSMKNPKFTIAIESLIIYHSTVKNDPNESSPVSYRQKAMNKA